MAELFESYFNLISGGLLDSLYMVGISTVMAYIIGIPAGLLLFVTKPAGLYPNRSVNISLEWVVNIGRSIPFLILLIVLIPFTRFVVGTVIGPKAAIIPLSIGASPLVARMVENALAEIDSGMVEACRCMGAKPMEIMFRVLLVESLPSLIRGFAIITITLLSYSTLAGVIGSGGLGDIAVRYGVHRGRSDVMYIILVLLVVMVGIIQTVFNHMAERVDKKNI